MQNIILVVHILACIALTIVILLQRSEGGALGIGGGGGGGGGLMSGRAAVNALVRTTMIFGGLFMLTTLALTALANNKPEGSEVTRQAAEAQQEEAVEVPADPAETTLIDPVDTPAPEDKPAPEDVPAPEEAVENPDE